MSANSTQSIRNDVRGFRSISIKTLRVLVITVISLSPSLGLYYIFASSVKSEDLVFLVVVLAAVALAIFGAITGLFFPAVDNKPSIEMIRLDKEGNVVNEIQK